jgi:hypothetical protein
LDIDEELIICFIDRQKAFDRVNWTKLMQILNKTGNDWRERRLISNLYFNRPVLTVWITNFTQGLQRVMVTGNPKCLPTIFQVGYLWLNNILRFNFYSSLQLIHLQFTIHLILPRTDKNLITNYTSLYLSLYRSELIHTSVSHQVSRKNIFLG